MADSTLQGNNTESNWVLTKADLQSVLFGSNSALLLQTVIFANNASSDGSGRLEVLVNVTGSTENIELPYAYPNGTNCVLGDPGLGYPPPLYPNLTILNEPSPSTGNNAVFYQDRPQERDSVIFLGPYTLNETFSLFSMTMAILDNDSAEDLLGWLTVVIDVSMLYSIANSPEGLGSTGEVLLIGPAEPDNKFSQEIRGSSVESASNREVHFILPPQSNSTLGNRHGGQYMNKTFNDTPFRMSSYPAVVDAWTMNNSAINNAGAIISSCNEEDLMVSVGYATVSNRLVDWVLVIERSYGNTLCVWLYLSLTI